MKRLESLANILCDIALTPMVMVIVAATITIWCSVVVSVTNGVMFVILLADGMIAAWTIVTFCAAIYLSYLERRENRNYLVK